MESESFDKTQDKIFDTIIIGGGPAGCAAAVYTARKNLKILLITESFGGQSIVSNDIQNWIGEVHITGLDMAKKLENHVRSYPDMVEVKSPEKVTAVKSIACTEAADGGRMCDFIVKTDKDSYRGKTVIIASGARRKRLGIPGEDKLESRGVSFCSTCDAPIFVNKKVVVVGGGNAGLETVEDLFPYASEIFLIEYTDSIKGDHTTFEKIKDNPKLKAVILNAQVLEIMGGTMVDGIKYKDRLSGEEKTLEVGGVFVEIGAVPNSEIIKDLVQLNEHGEVIVNFERATTSHPGIFAAGDVTIDPYKQNNISMGDGVKAALATYNYLLNRQKLSPAAESV